MKHLPGSALLIVVFLTTGLMLFSATIFWVDAFLLHSTEHMIQVHKMHLLADGLAEYAIALFMDNKIGECPVELCWPPHQQSEYRGVISCIQKNGDNEINAHLYKEKQLIQIIRFNVVHYDDKLIIRYWHRTLFPNEKKF